MKKVKKFSIVAVVAIVAIVMLSTCLLAGCTKEKASDFVQPVFNSQNALEGATIANETLKKGEKADAKNILADDKKCWTPTYMNNSPPQDEDKKPTQIMMNTVVEIHLNGMQTFNTALIKEIGNEVQYFRLQVWENDMWKDVYKAEKIQLLRLCSFDTVTTDKVRLSIDKFRSKTKPAKINSIALYNEAKRNVDDFNVTVYQRLDGDVPSELLKKRDDMNAAEAGTGDAYIRNYARFYDVYNCVLVFGAISWTADGEMTFNFKDGETGFKRELDALKEIVSYRSDPNRKVDIICTALADGTGGSHGGVNVFMDKNWEGVADKIIAFMAKYDLDGIDIDWEYPQNKKDWVCFNNFITKLDNGMNEIKPNAILSGAISSWSLGMSKDVLDRFDQIQFMAYDGFDMDGYQSSLEQAEQGLQKFVEKGVNIKKINIGIALYGRPNIGGPYWPSWRDISDTPDMYWNSLQYNVLSGGQLMDATFCSPALAGDKTAYAILAGAGGVMTFRIGCDKTMDSPNSIALGIENTLKRYLINY